MVGLAGVIGHAFCDTSSQCCDNHGNRGNTQQFWKGVNGLKIYGLADSACVIVVFFLKPVFELSILLFGLKRNNNHFNMILQLGSK